MGAMCDKCIDASSAGSKPSQQQILETQWAKMCPPLFMDTDTELLPCRDLSLRAMQWKYDRMQAKPGLNLWGYPRTGKTRTMFLILRAAHFSGLSVKIFGPSEFAQGCEQRPWQTAPWIKALAKADIVAFDDVDKCKLTRPQEDKFFALLDARSRNRRPTFFTGNSNGDRLVTLFKNGEAIIGRIRDCCQSYHFPAQKSLPLTSG